MTPEPEDDAPGLPGISSWRGVYGIVFGCFVLVVLGLTLFSRYFA